MGTGEWGNGKQSSAQRVANDLLEAGTSAAGLAFAVAPRLCVGIAIVDCCVTLSKLLYGAGRRQAWRYACME